LRTPLPYEAPTLEQQTPVPARRKGIFLLPNLLTTGGLFAGFFSIVAAIDGNFSGAAWATIVAIVTDGLDGRIARMTSTESDFGKEYDSLADMVSFGVAPAIVTYQWGVERLSEYGALWGRLGWLATFLYAVAAAFRLARFNTTTATIEKRYFQGLASPPAAAAVVSMVWLNTSYEIDPLVGLVLGIPFTAVIGILMVSRFRYLSFKDVNPGRRLRFAHLLLIPLVIIVIALEPAIVIFVAGTAYAASAPLAFLWRHRRLRRTPDGDDTQAPDEFEALDEPEELDEPEVHGGAADAGDIDAVEKRP
jgi:CDP-diacylglycerol--serine O-phosphatidyltransferase